MEYKDKVQIAEEGVDSLIKSEILEELKTLRQFAITMSDMSAATRLYDEIVKRIEKLEYRTVDRELREKTEVEKAIEQFHFPLTPDEFKEEMEKYDIRKEELKELLEEAKKHRREVIEKEYKSEK